MLRFLTFNTFNSSTFNSNIEISELEHSNLSEILRSMFSSQFSLGTIELLNLPLFQADTLDSNTHEDLREESKYFSLKLHFSISRDVHVTFV